MPELECQTLCLGMGIHYPYYVDTGSNLLKPLQKEDSCFSLSQKTDFQEYLQKAFRPAMECALTWLDSGECLSFSVSGVAMDQLLDDESDAAEVMKQAVNHKGVELLGQTYYHSVAGLFSEKDEFMYQTRRHIELVKELIGRKPLIFENTEFVFNSGLVEILKDIGFSALYSEGHDHLHSELNPNYVYSCRNLPLLLRNCRLSDDIAHRFHDSNWDQYPLSPETFARWIAKTPGDCIHIFLDARTFSGSREEAYALSDFFGSLPEALHSNNITTTLPESVISGPSKGELRLEDIGMCSYDGTCALTGIQNMFQQSAFWCLEDGKTLINDKEVWRRLQSTDHFSRMAIKSGSCGRLAASCTSQEAYDYFNAYMRGLAHCETIAVPHFRSRLAARALRCLSSEKAFHFFSPFRYIGYSAHSLREFSMILEFVPDEVFRFHSDRNDFSRWISDVIGDENLAAKIARCTGADEAADIVRERVRELCRRLK